MGRARITAPALALALVSGCFGVEDPIGVDEPIAVHGGILKQGKLPGVAAGGEPVEGRPSITSFEIGTARFRPGAFEVPLRGWATEQTYSIGVRILDEGSGYWVVPAGAEDPIMPGLLTWELAMDVGHELEPGRHQLGLVAIDEKGRGGVQTALDVCVTGDLPDNGNVCDPKKEPPYAVASLRWNQDSDLDLIVIAPDGTRYSRQNFSQVVDGTVVARLDADGVAGCQHTARRVENFVWSEKPQKGTWYIYANLFDACQKQAVSFELTTYRQERNDDETFSLSEQRVISGELLRAQTKPDSTTPLYLTSIDFP